MEFVKLIKENAALRKENATLQELYDSKNEQVHRYIKEVARLENNLESIKRDNLRLNRKLAFQSMVMDYLAKQNADLIVASAVKKKAAPSIFVQEVKTDGKINNRNC